jgi:hypothetical protein
MIVDDDLICIVILLSYDLLESYDLLDPMIYLSFCIVIYLILCMMMIWLWPRARCTLHDDGHGGVDVGVGLGKYVCIYAR